MTVPQILDLALIHAGASILQEAARLRLYGCILPDKQLFQYAAYTLEERDGRQAMLRIRKKELRHAV